MKKYLKNLTIIIVTFHSEYYLSNILRKLKNFKVIIVENSNNRYLKRKIEKKYKNVNFILSGSNIGFGSAINIALVKNTSKFYLIVNPDCEFDVKTISKLYNIINKQKNISVISPSTIDKKNRKTIRHGYFISTFNKMKYIENSILKEVDFVIGHFFLIRGNLFKKVGMFDENIFLNYEEIDLFKRLKKKNYKIFIHKKSFVKHLDGYSGFLKQKKSNSLHEMMKNSKWHLAWSKFYYYKKNYNYLFALVINISFLLQNFSKYIYFIFINDKKKIEVSKSFLKGSLASLNNKKSYYRPKF